MLAAALLRIGGQLELAAEVLQQRGADVPGTWHTAWDNEKAALAWHAGRTDEALASWESLPHTVPVLFNQGMATLFADRPAEARRLLTKAISLMPDDTPWNHLARLYLALAEMRT